MNSAQVTLNEIITAVRELTFDRFIIPAFALKQMQGDVYVQVDKTYEDPSDPVGIKGQLRLYKVVKFDEGGIEKTKEENIVTLSFNEYKTMEDLMNKLIEEGIVVAYTPYFRGTEPSTALIQVKKNLSEDFTAFRKYFFSDDEIRAMIEWYYYRVLDIKNVDLKDDTIAKLIRPSERHMTLWVSYFLVEKRRLYENAAAVIGQSFTDGSDYVGSVGNAAGNTTTVNIGSVFTVTEDPSTGYFSENFNGIGSDNTWGDRYSFWYKLQLYIRDLLETQFGDYSLRKDTVMQGHVQLERELDFRSYYDSFPFTLSPLSRGILSKTP